MDVRPDRMEVRVTLLWRAPLVLLLLASLCMGESPPAVPPLAPGNLSPEEITAYENECASGDGYRCFLLAAFLERASSDPREAGRARELAETACGRGLPLACFQAARFSEEGVGVYPDPRRALFRYRAACMRFHLEACYREALLLERGIGTDKDPDRARRVLERTCHHQTLNNCRDIAREIHVREPRISRIQSEHNLCTRGWNLACHRLGETAENPVHARLMFERACGRGHEPSCQRLSGESTPDPTT